LDRVADKTRVTLLGDYRIGRDDGSPPIAIKSKKGRALFAFLALHLDRPVSRSRVAALLWQEQPEIAGRQSLRQILTELRNEIGPRFDHGVSKDNIQLSSRDFSVDAVEFVRLSRSPSGYEAAVSLYTGDLTTDFDVRSSDFEDWLLAERRKLHNQAVEIFDTHAKMLVDKGEQKQALAICERLLALDPLRESTHRTLLRLDAAVNGRASAIALSEKLKAMLSAQLGVSPEPATIAVIESLTKAKDVPQPRGAVEPQAGVDLAAQPAPRARRFAGYLLAAALASALSGVLWYVAVPRNSSSSQIATDPSNVRRDKLVQNADTAYSIAVLPFTVRAESDDLKRFASSLEEDVIDSLSRAPRFLVISRQTTRAYRNTDRDAR
jgi:DNA-binding SARP family transcriptional activator